MYSFQYNIRDRGKGEKTLWSILLNNSTLNFDLSLVFQKNKSDFTKFAGEKKNI